VVGRRLDRRHLGNLDINGKYLNCKKPVVMCVVASCVCDWLTDWLCCGSVHCIQSSAQHFSTKNTVSAHTKFIRCVIFHEYRPYCLRGRFVNVASQHRDIPCSSFDYTNFVTHPASTRSCSFCTNRTQRVVPHFYDLLQITYSMAPCSFPYPFHTAQLNRSMRIPCCFQ